MIRWSTIDRVPRAIFLFTVLAILTTGCQVQQHPEHSNDAAGTAIPSERHVVPVFTGTDQTGAVFTSDSLRGQPWIGSFFFTTCTTVCPALNTVKAELQREFGTTVTFVSISTDPERDTPEALAAYAQEYGAQPGSWWMIRMPADSMRVVATSGFMLMDPEHPDMHSTRLVAVNADMTIAGYFDSTDSTHVSELRTWITSLPSTPR